MSACAGVLPPKVWQNRSHLGSVRFCTWGVWCNFSTTLILPNRSQKQRGQLKILEVTVGFHCTQRFNNGRECVLNSSVPDGWAGGLCAGVTVAVE